MNLEEFQAKYSELKKTIPREPTHSYNNENSDFVGYTYRSPNCYFCFDCVDCKNCLCCFDCVRSVDCVDCDYCVDSELLYFCTDCFKVYNSNYIDYSGRTYDSYFCYDCDDCHDLFGCVHLSHKQYCIFNKQFSKDEYLKEIQKLLVLPAEENLKKLKELIKKYPFGPSNVSSSQNSDYGNHVHYCTNCYLCFDTAHTENSAYLYDCAFCKDSYDLTYCFKAELCYECTDSAKVYNCDYLENSVDCFDCSYLMDCTDCHNCFGCAGLSHKKFCFLNKQLTEEEYKRASSELKEGAH